VVDRGAGYLIGPETKGRPLAERDGIEQDSIEH